MGNEAPKPFAAVVEVREWAVTQLETLKKAMRLRREREKAMRFVMDGPDGKTMTFPPSQDDRVAKLEEALRFYANRYSWRSSTVYMCGHSGQSSAELDGGAKARAALGGDHD